MIRRLPIALAQIKANNASKKLLNEIRQVIYSLYRVNKITENVYDNKVIKLNGYYIYEF